MNARVFATVRYLVRQRLASGRPLTYVDATHLTPWERKPYVQLAQRYGCQLEALFFDVPSKPASPVIKRATAWFPSPLFSTWRAA